MVLWEGALTLLDAHYMKQIFLFVISEDILNLFVFQMLYLFNF